MHPGQPCLFLLIIINNKQSQSKTKSLTQIPSDHPSSINMQLKNILAVFAAINLVTAAPTPDEDDLEFIDGPEGSADEFDIVKRGQATFYCKGAVVNSKDKGGVAGTKCGLSLASISPGQLQYVILHHSSLQCKEATNTLGPPEIWQVGFLHRLQLDASAWLREPSDALLLC
ncbi:hypothetical protein BO99DRAFT_468184 [Aspergillus violaceofuscus CBS 115571]|uniref:Uncharacterized protein n=1 Tax=Aspergillus violaceofuscus (strain CBS 115571) TaxID=1450538 RepID=A0A2V5H0S6_ASPV1|nr:hypothetical protein BO99DRAFT_468184 [Aspergillus violaceofuscus CBS 115571]